MSSTLIATVGLLLLSNLFMTVAWYGHLRFTSLPLWLAVIASWGLAFFEYCLQVPANRIGYRAYSAYELKTLQEVITLSCSSSSPRCIWEKDSNQNIWLDSFCLDSLPGQSFRTIMERIGKTTVPYGQSSKGFAATDRERVAFL